MPGKVFISYRRSPDAANAGRVYDRLRQNLPKHQVFMDVDGVKPGEDFREAIDAAISNSAILLVIIGEGWTDLESKDGRRIDKPNDVVRLEIEAALKHDIRIIPVLIDNAAMPSEEALPESVRPLAKRHAVNLRHTHFHDDANNLVGSVFQTVTTKKFHWFVIPFSISCYVLSWLLFIGLFAKAPFFKDIHEDIQIIISFIVPGIIAYYGGRFYLWGEERGRQQRLAALAAKQKS